jgi:natural product biosynthesis luciferase-like monooxygenase protein
MKVSLLFFANRESTDVPEQYALLEYASRFADNNGLHAVWVPERHFHPFGGAYPNPALAAMYVAASTARVRIRAGSVLLPLHDVLTVAEDWAFIDNVSNGRVDIAVGTGWIPNDFVLAPENYEIRKDVLFTKACALQKLWSGEPISRKNGDGLDVEVRVYPPAMQPNLNMWLTAASNIKTFEEAGSRGFNVLTALLFQTPSELAEKVDAYRKARAEAGLNPSDGTVTLMVHTFIGNSDQEVRELVRAPFIRYLRSSIDLWKGRFHHLEMSDSNRLAEFAFERYFRTAAMFGSLSRAEQFANSLRNVGVDEIACLIDFGVADGDVRAALPQLGTLARNLRVYENENDKS